MSGEAMVRMVLKKINGKKEIRYLSHPLKRMLCRPLIQKHDFACCSWYPNMSISLKTKLQTLRILKLGFFFGGGGLKDRTHITKNEFQK